MGALQETYRPKVLILVNHVPKNAEQSGNFYALRETLNQELGNNVEVEVAALKEFVFEINPPEANVYAPKRGIHIDDYSFVIFRLWSKQAERAAALVQYLKARGIPYVDGAVPELGASKHACAMVRWAAGLPIPKTVFATNQLLLEYMQKEQAAVTFPLILKATVGRKGRDNYLVKDIRELSRILKKNQDVEFVIQEFVQSKGDYRFLVFGNEVAAIIHRRSKTSHLNNTSQGGTAKLVKSAKFEPYVLDDVLQAVKLEKLDLAGVDVIFNSKTGQHYFLEVNRAPQINTGAFTDLKIAAFAHYLRKVSARRYKRKHSSRQPLTVVGRHLTIDLPSLGVKNLPAKIDSGAYNCALHAENVNLKGKTLHFDIPLKREDKAKLEMVHCKTTDFRTVQVKNSFGNVQVRYAVPITMLINGRMHEVDTTLANRGSMKYPLLLGRRLLRSNFLINVELSRR